ncbi:transcription antiterminator [Rhizobium sp. CG5]|uniref:transcription termination/antitermination protein NusG n=1 Tax=Rhizobium sp. CG5 TaxID=2726076 RepID=UPI002033EF0F|nr:transcription termination/antitermination NusG family protein [Rhizobium sp. CG5]MCM2472139.1 transcription antiterminator [Rhizobium sp. CG5]
MMQHRRGDIDGPVIEIRDYAVFKREKAISENAIRIHNIGMASRRIADDYPDLAAWFCLRVKPRTDFVVEKALADAGVHCLVATRKGDKIVKRHRIIPSPMLPVLPGYVMVRCVPHVAAMAGLRRFDNVVDVVGGAETPYRVPMKFVSKFIEKASNGEYDYRPPSAMVYHLGEAVRVVDGPFASFNGAVVEMGTIRNRIKVDVDIFGRLTPVELDIAQIEKV